MWKITVQAPGINMIGIYKDAAQGMREMGQTLGDMMAITPMPQELRTRLAAARDKLTAAREPLNISDTDIIVQVKEVRHDGS